MRSAKWTPDQQRITPKSGVLRSIRGTRSPHPCATASPLSLEERALALVANHVSAGIAAGRGMTELIAI